MSDTIQDLYGSFSEQMEPIQEDDRYFRYLFEMAQASDTTIEQKREELEKVVDEEWIGVIEESLDAINAIIEKPRRFITTEEEVVPVSLAKRISADSVRHLSQNTQFLAPSEDGDVHPTHVLNVNTAETYDLYENRFVYHLIQRLLTFVDKRTDVIFWNTGNEICNRFKMHSKIDDAYEEIEYTVEMSVKNRQSFAENEADNVDTFMRIDRVRRLVMSLASTSFCKIMAGCSTVRSPIQRTNLIKKDPNYRTCYRLWQFMERYDEVGYAINIKDSELAFDDEYRIQMYTNLINNYTVFKSLIGDERNLDEVESSQREPVRPKFVKEFAEELVADPDLPDVEVRRVFVEEVTQAQLDAETALAEEREAAAGLREQVEALQTQVERERAEATVLAERARAEAEAQIEGARTEAAALAEERDARAREAEAARAEAEARVADAQAACDEAVAAARAACDEAVEAAKAAGEEAAAAAKSEAGKLVAAAKADAEAIVAKERASAAEQLEAARGRTDAAEAQVAEKDAELAALRACAASELAEAKDAAKRELDQVRSACADELSEAVSEAERKYAAQLSQAQKEMQEQISSLIRDLEQTEKARQRAEKRAEGNSLSHYLLKRLRGLESGGDRGGNEDSGSGKRADSAEDANADREGGTSAEGASTAYEGDGFESVDDNVRK